MDAVILAGGKGSRLNGIMPPYWKPLLPHLSVPLVRRIYEQVEPVADEHVFVIAAPENALQISQIMPTNRLKLVIVVQREARGPGDALMLALRLTKQKHLLVVMGDNLMPDEDVKNVCAAVKDSPCGLVIGTGEVETKAEAQRFTRIVDQGPYQTISEGPRGLEYLRKPYTVWCGPLVVPVTYTIDAMNRDSIDMNTLGERKIGTHLGDIGPAALVPCSAIDVGTPETIMEVQA
jgi:molybdopterin-guanine dinucleotide biosynthesis protein A